MTDAALNSAIAAEHRRDLIADAQRARLVREATAAPAPPTAWSRRPRWVFGRRTASA